MLRHFVKKNSLLEALPMLGLCGSGPFGTERRRVITFALIFLHPCCSQVTGNGLQSSGPHPGSHEGQGGGAAALEGRSEVLPDCAAASA